MPKVKEPMVAYKPRKVTSRQSSMRTYLPSQLRALPPEERSRILAGQAKHAAAMFAAGSDEIIADSTSPIEY